MKKIHNFLKNLSKEEMAYLKLGIDYAEFIWGIQKRFTISDKEMIKRLGWTKAKFKNCKVGAYNFSIVDLSKLECIMKDEIYNSQIVDIVLKK